MNIKKIFAVFVILVPIIEIVLFIEIGGFMGSLNTVIFIILSAFLGVYLIKNNAKSHLFDIQQQMIRGIRPDKEIFSGIIVFLCGIFLIIPGFFTDFLALLFLIKPIRLSLINKSYKEKSGQSRRSKDNIIDIDHRHDD